MNEIDTDLGRAASEAIQNMIQRCDKNQKEHFVQVLLALAKCYDHSSENRAVVIVSHDDVMLTMSINSDQWETAGLVQLCYDSLNLGAFRQTPDNYQTH